ncbi:sugar-binding transcriptional regulator [Vermiculatibacterium agrestimuris]|uniref:sugar-binding transcriptional regulator n=1 Tax=Vermiculatibacterium agrestimuris TaxID=2941519 RepID=UPI002040C10B|nr:sugar-binding transcriptional regulator [Vermiculatibacterium agrestimuris]
MEERLDKIDKLDYEHILMVKAVWYYYIESYTQQNISKLLGVSRSKVISLLERARQTGVIQFNVRQESSRRMQLEQDMIARFGLSDVFIVPGASTLTSPNESIAQAAAMYILRRAEDNAFINMGYGDTTSRILNHLATAAQSPLNVVSLTGGVNYYLPNTRSNVFNARLYLIPSPLLLSSGELRQSLRQEPDVGEIFRMIPLSSMSVVGIGSMNDQATILKNGILNQNDFTFLKMQGAVGDVLSHFLDKNGNPISIELEDRLMSTPLEELRKLDNVIGVAGGARKAEAILAALRGGYLDVLITDEDTAKLLLETPEP